MEIVRQTINSSQLDKIQLPKNFANRMVEVIIIPAKEEVEDMPSKKLSTTF